MSGTKNEASTYATPEEWAHKRLQDVTLETGITVQFKLPDLTEWIARDHIPNPLMAIAERLEFEAIDPEKLTHEELANYIDLRDFIIATHVVQPDILGMFDGDDDEKRTQAVAWVKEHIPPMDRQHLWLVAGHIAIPESALRSLADMFPGGQRPDGDAPPSNVEGDGSPAE